MIYPDIHQSRNHIQNKTIDKYHIAGILSEKSTAVDITNELAESQKTLGIMLSPKYLKEIAEHCIERVQIQKLSKMQPFRYFLY